MKQLGKTLLWIWILILVSLNSWSMFNGKTQSERSINFKAKERPNLVLVLVDDLGYADVGFNGCKDIPTPNIDRIADQGVIFTNGYVTWAACGPSRAGIITGRYQDRFGFGRNPLFAPNDPEMGLPLSEETLPDVLKKANYKSVAIGKWHLGAHESLRPLKRGFDDFYGFLSGGHQYFPEKWTLADEYAAKSQGGGYRTKLLRNDERIDETEYLTDALSREAVNYIEKYKDASFFMYLAYNAPHGPLQATEKYLTRFNHIKDIKRRTYAAMVSAVDDGVGLVLDKLESLNLSKNTIVVFLSDNGGPERGHGSDNGSLRGTKGHLLEGGIRVPFAMMWPSKIKPKTVYDNPIISLDIFSTIIAQGEKSIETKNPIDGVNLIPYISGDKEGLPHERLFWRTYDKEDYAIREGEYKLVQNSEEEGVFNLQNDLSEENDLQKKLPNKYDLLKERYEEWQKQMKPPIFMGLKQNSEYNKTHPKRFVKSN
ncbi:sulfatase-like hydrolase/transferase [Snuella sedimenti]|uniref:Sulfatase-like hydrolase/transferase n=1 Tax=Snuella sedimenti TaxID=2798802 RepID=A0A8J7J6W4_9FLAO|nr:sulfatase-like hydrolase/transferase [Snuella sedimenti]MBJ6369614.1 sulfatase-like hydrolase/transferase [Snuella sedimenti]